MSVEDLASELSAEALRRRLADVVAFGSRFSGTQGEAACREYLLAEFASLGLADVAPEPFPYLGYAPVSARCISLDDGAELVCRPLQSTAVGEAQGEAVFVGEGAPADLASAAMTGGLAGKVVLAQPRNLFAFARSVSEAGIAALVYVAPTESGLIGSFTAALYPPPLAPPWEGRVLGFPGVTLEASAARRLIARMTSRPVALRVAHEAVYAEAQSANVLGSVYGTELTDETVIVGAHYDTQLECPGAWDNGTGLASLLQIAAALIVRPQRRTVRFVAFAVEEPALWGSYTHTVRRFETMSRVVGMVNLDTVGAPINGPRVLVASSGIRELAGKAAAAAGWTIDEWEDPDQEPYFDHTPFVDAGVPVACFLQSRLPHPYYHSPGDTIELVDFQSMSIAATASALTVVALASG